MLGQEIGPLAARHATQRMTQQSLGNPVLTRVDQVMAQQSPDYASLARDPGGLALGCEPVTGARTSASPTPWGGNTW